MKKVNRVVSLLLILMLALTVSAVAFANTDGTKNEPLSEEKLQSLKQLMLDVVSSLMTQEELALFEQQIAEMPEGNLTGSDERAEAKRLNETISNNNPRIRSMEDTVGPVIVYDGVMINGKDCHISVYENGSVAIGSLSGTLIEAHIQEDANDVEIATAVKETPKEKVNESDPPTATVTTPTSTDNKELSETDAFVKAVDGAIRIEINGKYINTDVEPFIDEYNRTQAPFRAVGESLGCAVEWNETDRKVTCTKEGAIVEMFIGDANYLVNGSPKVMDTAPQIKDGRTFIPVRALGEALSCDVSWNPDTLLVSISHTPAF